MHIHPCTPAQSGINSPKRLHSNCGYFPSNGMHSSPENQAHIHNDLEHTFSGQVIQNTEKSCVPKCCLQSLKESLSWLFNDKKIKWTERNYCNTNVTIVAEPRIYFNCIQLKVLYHHIFWILLMTEDRKTKQTKEASSNYKWQMALNMP